MSTVEATIVPEILDFVVFQALLLAYARGKFIIYNLFILFWKNAPVLFGTLNIFVHKNNKTFL